jgi:hypothetical protein
VVERIHPRTLVVVVVTNRLLRTAAVDGEQLALVEARRAKLDEFAAELEEKLTLLDQRRRELER